MPPKAVLGLGLVRGGKALAGDWGLLKAELRDVGKPCMFCVWEVAEPPRLREPIAVRGSTWITQCSGHSAIIKAKIISDTNTMLTLTQQNHTGEIASRLLVLGARPFGMTPGGGWRALFITLLQLATMVRIVSDSSCDTLLTQHKGHRSKNIPKFLQYVTQHLSIISLYCSHYTTVTICWFVNSGLHTTQLQTRLSH